MKLYKYNQKNNKNRSMSFFNGSERVGFSVIECGTQEEIDAAEAKGFSNVWPPVKSAKKTAPKVEANDGQNSSLHNQESATGS